QPLNNIKENFVPADKHIAHYRENIREWEAMGWRIDQDEVERNEHQVAYAIPCPDRRNSKNWTLDPVPLISATTGGAEVKIASAN
ncbi:MAG: hypothetical protein QF580_08625, partial [Gammaproteobacteria bacterium]|nr:hypothetical protein [Gammaproteobacteria bacterium]